MGKMTKKDRIDIQRILLGNLQQAQCTFNGNHEYVYSQEVADYFKKQYDDFTEMVWKERNNP